MEQGPQHRATHVATRVSALGTASQPLPTPQLPRALFREDVSLRELLLQLPLRHRALRRDCSWRRQEHPDAEATSQESTSETSRIWLGHDFITNEHILALPLQYDEEDIEQLQGVQPPVLRHHPQAVSPPQEQQPQVLQPPPGLPQPPQALQPRPLVVKQQAVPLPAPLLQGLPPKVQAVPVPPAPQAAHRPPGKHYNHPRGPPPKVTNIIDIPHEDELQELLGPNLVDITVDSGILQVATNVDKKEQQLQRDLIKQTIELQDFYEDDLSQYTEDDIKAAQLHGLGKMNIYGEVDIDSLTPEQQRRVIKTRWVIGPRPSSISVDDIDITTGPLKAHFVAKGYSQYISDHRPHRGDFCSYPVEYIIEDILTSSSPTSVTGDIIRHF